MSMTLAEYEAYLCALAERMENIHPVQQKTTKPAKKKLLIKKQFHNMERQTWLP